MHNLLLYVLFGLHSLTICAGEQYFIKGIAITGTIYIEQQCKPLVTYHTVSVTCKSNYAKPSYIITKNFILSENMNYHLDIINASVKSYMIKKNHKIVVFSYR